MHTYMIVAHMIGQLFGWEWRRGGGVEMASLALRFLKMYDTNVSGTSVNMSSYGKKSRLRSVKLNRHE